MSQKIIVIFTGFKGSGKSTCMSVFQQKLGANKVNELILAKKVKDFLVDYFSFESDIFENQAKKEAVFEEPVKLTDNFFLVLSHFFNVNYQSLLNVNIKRIFFTPRDLIRVVATDLLKVIDVDIHCRFLKSSIVLDKVNIVVDLRFVSELDYIRRNFQDYKIVLVSVLDAIAENKALRDLRDKTMHASEKEVFELIKQSDFQIANTVKDIDSLSKKIEHLIYKLNL